MHLDGVNAIKVLLMAMKEASLSTIGKGLTRMFMDGHP